MVFNLRYNVKSVKEIRYIPNDIDNIFERHVDGNNYTKNALLFQDIIRYYFVINKNPSENNNFRKNDLQMWIVKNNLEIINYFQGSKAHSSYSNRIHAKEGRINMKFDILMEMGLIRQTGTGLGRKVKVQIPLYSYTLGGILLALITRNFSLKNEISFEKDSHKIQNKKQDLKDNIDRIYNLLYSSLPEGENYPYSNIFYRSFLKKIMEKGVFEKVVDYMIDLCHSGKKIRNMVDLIEHIYFLDFDIKTDRTNFSNLFFETLDEQKVDVKDLFIYDMKLNVQRRFEYIKRFFSRKYERERFRLRADHEKIVLEGNCNKCNKIMIVIWSYIKYRKKRVESRYNGEIRITCKYCRSKDSCIIPAF